MKKIKMSENNWIRGIPNELINKCGYCEESVDFDYSITDSLWKKIIPKDLQLGVVCLKCADVFATNIGLDISSSIKEIYYCGINKTILLAPAIQFDWEE